MWTVHLLNLFHLFWQALIVLAYMKSTRRSNKEEGRGRMPTFEKSSQTVVRGLRGKGRPQVISL